MIEKLFRKIVSLAIAFCVLVGAALLPAARAADEDEVDAPVRVTVVWEGDHDEALRAARPDVRLTISRASGTAETEPVTVDLRRESYPGADVWTAELPAGASEEDSVTAVSVWDAEAEAYGPAPEDWAYACTADGLYVTLTMGETVPFAGARDIVRYDWYKNSYGIFQGIEENPQFVTRVLALEKKFLIARHALGCAFDGIWFVLTRTTDGETFELVPDPNGIAVGLDGADGRYTAQYLSFEDFLNNWFVEEQETFAAFSFERADLPRYESAGGAEYTYGCGLVVAEQDADAPSTLYPLTQSVALPLGGADLLPTELTDDGSALRFWFPEEGLAVFMLWEDGDHANVHDRPETLRVERGDRAISLRCAPIAGLSLTEVTSFCTTEPYGGETEFANETIGNNIGYESFEMQLPCRARDVVPYTYVPIAPDGYEVTENRHERFYLAAEGTEMYDQIVTFRFDESLRMANDVSVAVTYDEPAEFAALTRPELRLALQYYDPNPPEVRGSAAAIGWVDLTDETMPAFTRINCEVSPAVQTAAEDQTLGWMKLVQNWWSGVELGQPVQYRVKVTPVDNGAGYTFGELTPDEDGNVYLPISGETYSAAIGCALDGDALFAPTVKKSWKPSNKTELYNSEEIAQLIEQGKLPEAVMMQLYYGADRTPVGEAVELDTAELAEGLTWSGTLPRSSKDGTPIPYALCETAVRYSGSEAFEALTDGKDSKDAAYGFVTFSTEAPNAEGTNEMHVDPPVDPPDDPPVDPPDDPPVDPPDDPPVDPPVDPPDDPPADPTPGEPGDQPTEPAQTEPAEPAPVEPTPGDLTPTEPKPAEPVEPAPPAGPAAAETPRIAHPTPVAPPTQTEPAADVADEPAPAEEPAPTEEPAADEPAPAEEPAPETPAEPEPTGETAPAGEPARAAEPAEEQQSSFPWWILLLVAALGAGGYGVSRKMKKKEK